MEAEHNENGGSGQLEYLQCVEMYPTGVRSMHYDGKQLLAVCRKGYSELHRVKHHKGSIYFDELVRFPESERLVISDGGIAIFGTTAVRMCDLKRWRTHSISTPPISTTVQGRKVYTHHQTYTMLWNLEELSYNLVNHKDVPYHVEKDGIRGQGKSLKGEFTCCYELNGHLYVGDANGCLSIFETQYLTLVKRIKKHEAAILAIVGSEKHNCVYVSGCDSRIICVRQLATEEFVVSSQCRGQSHDIYSMVLLGDDVLLSGGLTTDLCYYQLLNGNFTGEYSNRPSLPAKQLISVDAKQELLLVNQYSRFELWQRLGASLDLLVSFQVFAPLTEVALSAQARYLAYTNEVQTTVVSIDRDTHELTKLMNLPPALFLTFPEKHQLLIVTTDFAVVRVNLKKCSSEELFKIDEVLVPSNFQLLEQRVLLVASRLEDKLVLYNLADGEVVKLIERPFHFVQIHNKGLIVGGEFSLTVFVSSSEEPYAREFTIPVPIRKLRFGGDVPDRKEYWFGVGDGKAVFIHRLFRNNNKLIEGKCESKKSLRLRKIPTVYQMLDHGHRLTFVGIDFRQMVGKLENPVLAKKIL